MHAQKSSVKKAPAPVKPKESPSLIKAEAEANALKEKIRQFEQPKASATESELEKKFTQAHA